MLADVVGKIAEELRVTPEDILCVGRDFSSVSTVVDEKYSAIVVFNSSEISDLTIERIKEMSDIFYFFNTVSPSIRDSPRTGAQTEYVGVRNAGVGGEIQTMILMDIIEREGKYVKFYNDFFSFLYDF